mmetsp:Transcript_20737/g.28833  ORF Transcript_20737/g.28833 Transcript_20737/m.28833 type:complete len:358 (-) Transcript_20737:194-1267(-)
MAIVQIRLSTVLFAILSFLFLAVSPINGLSEEDGALESGQNYTRDGRIVGGTRVVNQDKYPFFARLRINDKKNLLHCGGSLIGPDLVLSAAHCYREPKDLIVGVSAYYLKNENVDESKEIVRSVRKIIRHPRYNRATFEFDFMILVLHQEVPGVQPIKLNQNAGIPAVGDDVKSIGLGSTVSDVNDYTPADYLQEVTLATLDIDFCNSKTRYDGLVQNPIMFCAGFQQGRNNSPRDPCLGDSGGPSLQMIKNVLVQVGVVSWGVGCAEQSYPGVYADVAAVYDWIDNTGCKDSKSKSGGHLSCHRVSTQAQTVTRTHRNRSRRRRPSTSAGGSGGNNQHQRSGFRPDADSIRRRPSS